jgi:hypothetical protein
MSCKQEGKMISRKSFMPVLFVFVILILVVFARAQVVPKPEEVLGFKVGDDYHLATYTQAVAYFKKLAENSDRIKLFDAGKTSQGQDMIYAVISSAENLANLEKYKSIARSLSLVKGMSAEGAKRAAAEGKAIVYIDGGLHAGECAPAQHNIQLAYNLVAANDSKTKKMLDDVILVLVFANPDGMNLLAEWYHPNVGTPYEVSPLPWLYHIYAGHDNNRDSYIANLVETQSVSRLVNQEWYPVILYNHHQTAPFPARIWTPPNSEPTNPNVHPLIVRWQNLIGSAMGADFDAEGKEGAISRIVFDTWYPGYMTQVVDSHNIISILTETALYRYATPYFYTVRDFPKEYQDLTMSAFYPNPWKGGWWRLRDAVDYCLTASMSVLNVGSKYREELLLNKYKMGKDVIEKFRKEPPYAWIIPEKQADPQSSSLLLNRMILLGIDIYRSDNAFSCDGLNFPAGTYIIPMDQPFSLFIKNVFEEQRYPDLRKYPDLWQGLVESQKFEGAPFESYDMMGWTLPYQFGMTTFAALSPVQVSMAPQKEILAPADQIIGSGRRAYILSHDQNVSFTATNRVLKAGGRVNWAKAAFSLQGESFPPGSILIDGGGVSQAFMQKIASELRLRISGVSEMPKVDTYSLKKPRLAMYKSWVSSVDEGWTRLILEQFEFPYTSIFDADIRAGNLRDSYDVIIIPENYSPELITEGYAVGTMPPKYVGGVSLNGLRNMRLFAEAGGTLIFLNSSCDLAVDNFSLPVRNVLRKIKPEEFLCSGSILRQEFDTSHPLAYGMKPEAGTVFSESCAFDIMPSFQDKKEPKSVAKYARENLLMSGYIFGEKIIQQKSSILEVPYGKGKVILLGFPVQFRAQPYGTFKLLFNAIFYGAASSGK